MTFAGNTAATLFGLGSLGAALPAAIAPISTAYSASEAFGRRCDFDDRFQEARVFYSSYGMPLAFAAAMGRGDGPTT